jgi:8-oxo-dGTP pyrophosphatase MutT (NUDIX family)
MPLPETSAYSLLPTFPTVFWGETEATFFAFGTPLPYELPPIAALVFAMQEGEFLLADISDRGWCILGGHLEGVESVEMAVRREAMEEAGAVLGSLHPVGTYLFRNTQTEKRTAVPVFWSEVLEERSLPANTESRGKARVTRAEIPQRYFAWDALIEAVFDYALSCYQRP